MPELPLVLLTGTSLAHSPDLHIATFATVQHREY
jgi:hypothetical protein